MPVASSDAQNRQPKAAQKPGDTTKWIIAGAVAVSVTLLCVAGFAVARAFFASSDPIDTVQIEIVQPPVLPEEVIPSEKPLAAPQSAVPTPPATDEPAPEQPTQAEPNIAELLRQRQIALQANIDQRVDEALKLVQKYGYGHVVVGQLKMEGNASPRDVVA